jgi:preprotein translocase subunit SecY
VAKPPNSPIAGLGEMSRLSELRGRFAFLLGGLIVYRIGTFIPVPGIDPIALARFFQDQAGTILSMFNMFSGGALQRLSIFALGVMPYISASIIVQMMAGRGAATAGAAQGRRVGPPQAHAVHALTARSASPRSRALAPPSHSRTRAS